MEPSDATASTLDSHQSLMARQMLLGLGGVRDVFLGGSLAQQSRGGGSGTWIAVTRDDGTSWDALTPKVQSLLEALPDEELSSSSSSTTADVHSSTDPGLGMQQFAPGSIEEQIMEVLDERVRPGVQADGGDVRFLAWDATAKEVRLRLEGACQGCPHSTATLHDNIKRALTYFVPEVQSVVADMAVDEASDSPTADIAWLHDALAAGDEIATLAARGTPFFSTFAGMKVEGPKLRRVKFLSRLELQGKTPEHVYVTCKDCNAKRTIEDPNDLLLAQKGNSTGDAAVVICPACCVLISR